MGTTAIPYATKTCNAANGCTPCSRGCLRCWAKALHDQRHKAILAGKKLAPQYRVPFETVQLLPERLAEPPRWRTPQRVFWCSTGDLFHKDVPDEYIAKCFAVMRRTWWHLHLVLTKRPDRMEKWARLHGADLVGHELGADDPDAELAFQWPLSNVLLGATICDQAEAERHIPVVTKLGLLGWRTWLSLEPLLGPVSLGLGGTCPKDWGCGYSPVLAGLEWVVVGAEACAGVPRKMELSWMHSVAKECDLTSTLFYGKQVHFGTHHYPRVSTKPTEEWPVWARDRDLPPMPEPVLL